MKLRFTSIAILTILRACLSIFFILKDIGVSALTSFCLDNRPCESRYHITWDRLGYLTTTIPAVTSFTTDAMTTSVYTVKGQLQKNQ